MGSNRIIKATSEITKKYLEDIVFIEILEDRENKYDQLVKHGITQLPVYVGHLAENIRQNNIDSIPADAIIRGMITVIGADPFFKRVNNYVEFLDSADGLFVERIVQIGTIKAEENNFDEAALYFNAVLVFDPQNIDGLYNLGRVFYDLDKKYDDDNYKKIAVACFEELLILDPAMGEPKYFLGFFYYNAGNFQKAKIFWKQALEYIQNYEMREEIVVALGKVEDRSLFQEGSEMIVNGRVTEGLGLLKTIEENHDDWWELNFFIGLGNRMGEDHETALKYFLKTLSLNSGHIQTMNEIGICFMSLGDYESALDYYKEARRLEPQNAEIICNMGIVYLQKGDNKVAQSHFDHALELEPEDEVIQMWHKYIQTI